MVALPSPCALPPLHFFLPPPPASPSPSPFPSVSRSPRLTFEHEFFGIHKKNLPKMQPGPRFDPCHQFVRDTLRPGIDLFLFPSVIPALDSRFRATTVVLVRPFLCPFLAYLTIVNLIIPRTPQFIFRI